MRSNKRQQQQQAAPHEAREKKKKQTERSEQKKNIKLISMGKLLLIVCRWMEKSNSKSYHEIVPNKVTQLITENIFFLLPFDVTIWNENV